MKRVYLGCASQPSDVDVNKCSKLEHVPRQIRKTTKNHPREVAKKCVETYTPTNAVAQSLGEKAVTRTKKAKYVI